MLGPCYTIRHEFISRNIENTGDPVVTQRPARHKDGRTTKVRMWDKNQALEKALNYLGLYECENALHSENLELQVVLVGKVGNQPSDGPDLLTLTATKKSPAQRRG